MAYAKGTTHYNLPLTEGSDKRDWFDTNEPFNAVDSALHSAVEDTDTLKSEVSTLQSEMSEAQTDIKAIEAYDADNTVKVTGLQTLTTQHTVDIENVRQDTEDMICAVEEGSATAVYAHEVGDFFRYNDTLYVTTSSIAKGDTIVPDVNCRTTDIVTQLGGGDETLPERVKTLEGKVENVETKASKSETLLGDTSITSYGATVTDAIANSNIKALDGDIYTLKDGAWSKKEESSVLPFNLDFSVPDGTVVGKWFDGKELKVKVFKQLVVVNHSKRNIYTITDNAHPYAFWFITSGGEYYGSGRSGIGTIVDSILDLQFTMHLTSGNWTLISELHKGTSSGYDDGSKYYITMLGFYTD